MIEHLIPVLAGTLGAAVPLIFAGLGELVAPDEIIALLARARRLVDDPVLPAPPAHRPIPWPPF